MVPLASHRAVLLRRLPDVFRVGVNSPEQWRQPGARFGMMVSCRTVTSAYEAQGSQDAAGDWCKSRLGALLRHAVRNAPSSISGVTFASRTLVAPCRPHPPGTGENSSGASSTIPACCSGVRSSVPNPSFSRASVAKIFPATLKSGLLKCDPSTASGMLRAIRRKPAPVITSTSSLPSLTPSIWREGPRVLHATTITSVVIPMGLPRGCRISVLAPHLHVELADKLIIPILSS
jgi:hypothetical protein